MSTRDILEQEFDEQFGVSRVEEPGSSTRNQDLELNLPRKKNNNNNNNIKRKIPSIVFSKCSTAIKTRVPTLDTKVKGKG